MFWMFSNRCNFVNKRVLLKMGEGNRCAWVYFLKRSAYWASSSVKEILRWVFFLFLLLWFGKPFFMAYKAHNSECFKLLTIDDRASRLLIANKSGRVFLDFFPSSEFYYDLHIFERKRVFCLEKHFYLFSLMFS